MPKYSNNKEIFLKLLSIVSSDEIASLIKSDDFFQSGNCSWKPYGGRELNAPQIEGQMKSSSNALVEKLTNSTDALLMRRCYEVEGVAPESGNTKLPKTLLEAITKYFGTDEEINRKRSEWAKQHLVVLAEGDKKKPTITIVDRGEGQLPDRIQDTIVGLSESIKEKINFVFGKYHQGGSAAIRFCGSPSKCFQLVLSRRAESIAGKGSDNQWGFTLVRRNYKNRIAYYEYCADKDGKTFSFPYEKPIKIDGAEIGTRDIRCIRLKHINDAKGVESYKLQREKIFYVENGLALGYELDTFVRSDCQLPALAPYLHCYIDMSDIRVDLANIFHSGREELARTEDYQILKERLKKFFENEIFEKWNKEYEDKSLASANEDNKELDKLIEKAIVDDPELKELLGIGEEIKIPKGKDKE